MFAKKIAVPVLMTMLILLGGCTVIMKEMARPKMDRPLPVQPVISTEFKAFLVSKDLRKTPFYIRGVRYYDGDSMLKLREADMVAGRTGRVSNFTEDLPLLKDPPGPVSELGEMHRSSFADELRARGFLVSDEPCGECMEVMLEFAYWFDPGLIPKENTHIRASVSAYGVLFAQAREDTRLERGLGLMGDKNRITSKSTQEKKTIIGGSIGRPVDEMLYVIKKVLGKDTSAK